MSDVIVSICCSTFNHEKFIAYALDGFLMQKTNFAVEILINDDCSLDSTADILKDYDKRYPGKFKITFQTENQYSKGIKPLSQLTFPKVKGKYVAICEGDDFWTNPNKLQKQVDFLETHEDYSLCFHNCIMVDENNNEIESVFSHLEGKDYTGEDILRKWSVPTASTVFRAKYLNQIINRSKTKRYLYGDTPMFLTLLENGKSRCLSQKMSAYRVHSCGISRSFNKKNTLAIFNHYKTIRKDFNGKYRKIMAKIISKHTFEEGVIFIKTGRPAIGLKFIITAFFYNKTAITRHLILRLVKVKSKISI